MHCTLLQCAWQLFRSWFYSIRNPTENDSIAEPLKEKEVSL